MLLLQRLVFCSLISASLILPRLAVFIVVQSLEFEDCVEVGFQQLVEWPRYRFGRDLRADTVSTLKTQYLN